MSNASHGIQDAGVASNEGDPWIIGYEPLESSTTVEPSLHIERLRGIQPLDAQFGVNPKLSVPPCLHKALFGTAEGSTALATFALIDATRVQNLPELLGQSGLSHECLFKGAALERWSDSAPWLVKLDENSPFTRRLFTRDGQPWHLWDTHAGIYIRSASDLISLWRHFRKFTRVVDKQGRWFYLRFYDPAYLPDYASSLRSSKLKKFMSGVDSLVAIYKGDATILTVAQTDQSSSNTISGAGK